MATAVAIDTNALPEETWEDVTHGTIRWKTIFSGGQTPTEQIVCGIASMMPGQFFAFHHHAEPEVYFGLEGTGIVLIDGTPHELKPGVALFIPGNAVHGIPMAIEPLRFFYTFATDSFDTITYHFEHATLTAQG